jgi:hypothetical protein
MPKFGEEPLQDCSNECPDCGGIMKLIHATEFYMEGSGDNIQSRDYWECIDCDYYQEP